MEEKKSAAEPKNYAKFYEYCRGNVAKFLAERGGSYRGLTPPTFEKYGLGVHPNFGVEGREKCPHLIIPYDDEHFFARAIEGVERSQHGANAGLYEPLPIRNYYPAVNFIVEGEIDALSIAQVISNRFEIVGCVATGGATKYHKVVPELEKRFADAERKPSFIVMFDNDATGETNGRQLVCALKAAGYPAELFFLEENTAGEKVDANDLLQRDEGKLIKRLFDVVQQAEWKLFDQAEAMRKSAEQARQAAEDKSGMKLFSFTDYFADVFFSDIEKTSRYSERKTGFENIDSAQVFMPGLYVLGALPATGKTTFAWQLLNQLADNGETCIYCSYEMSRAELFTKSIARELYKRYPEMCERFNLSSVNIRRGVCRDMKEILDQAAAFANSSTKLKVAELSNTGIAELIEKLKPLVADVDKSAVICLDYLQIVPSKDDRPSSAKEKVDDIMLRLKDFQRETESTLIVISSLNRASYIGEAKISSFKESGAIEYSADVLWQLANHVASGAGDNDESAKRIGREKVRPIKLSCLKNRNGGQYDCFFRYHAAHDYFKATKEDEIFEEKRERPKHER